MCFDNFVEIIVISVINMLLFAQTLLITLAYSIIEERLYIVLSHITSGLLTHVDIKHCVCVLFNGYVCIWYLFNQKKRNNII